MRRALVALALVIVVACSYDGPSVGRVAEKDHQGQWVQMVWTGKVFVPITHPEIFNLRIEGDDDSDWIEVDQDTYESVQVGDCYDTEADQVRETGCDP